LWTLDDLSGAGIAVGHCPCALITQRTANRWEDDMSSPVFRAIAYCTDFSDNADEAFTIAKDLAWHFGANLHIVHVMVNFSLAPPIHSNYIPVEYEPRFIEQVTQASRESIEKRYLSQLKDKQASEVHLLSGYASTEILRFAQDNSVDLIVMGSHGLTGLAHVLFGSTADRVVRKAPCSVLTVRPKPSAA
jgi:nucleotide-binding universal stress UspA family protein